MAPSKIRRNRPGTVALKQIKKYQNYSGTLVRVANMQRLINAIIQNDDLGEIPEKWSKNMKAAQYVKVSKRARKGLHIAAETFAAALAANVNLAAIHAGRITVYIRDFKLVEQIKNEKFSGDFSELHRNRDSHAIPNPALRRLMRRGGVKRISKLALTELYIYICLFLMDIIHYSLLYMSHAERTMVNFDDVNHALVRAGQKKILGIA